MGIIRLGGGGVTPHASENIVSGIIVMPPRFPTCAGLLSVPQLQDTLLYIVGVHVDLVPPISTENVQTH